MIDGVRVTVGVSELVIVWVAVGDSNVIVAKGVSVRRSVAEMVVWLGDDCMVGSDAGFPQLPSARLMKNNKIDKRIMIIPINKKVFRPRGRKTGLPRYHLNFTAYLAVHSCLDIPVPRSTV